MRHIGFYGNTGSASIPLALWEARQQGRIGDGDLVLLTAFGAGFHWAAVLLRSSLRLTKVAMSPSAGPPPDRVIVSDGPGRYR